MKMLFCLPTNYSARKFRDAHMDGAIKSWDMMSTQIETFRPDGGELGTGI